MFFNIIRTRIKQGHRTMSYPDGPAPALPVRFAGLPVIRGDLCRGCNAPCLDVCPTEAISISPEGAVRLDLGRCVFCRECQRACSKGALKFGGDHRLGSATREGLVMSGEEKIPDAFVEAASNLYGKILSLRVVSAGGCGACEADTNVLNTLAWDLGRFGVQYVASPRHADGMILIGPVPENMAYAVRDTYDAIPEPKFVIAVGTCAISGGTYGKQSPCLAGRDIPVPVDLFIPGCPPHPLTILDGILRFIGRIPRATD